MKKSVFVIILSFFLTVSYAKAEDSVAVVDLQKIVSNSSQVKQLKQEHDKKLDELNKIVVNARGAIANETDNQKIIQLEEKYTKEFNDKKNALESEYNIRLDAIERSIKDEIAKKAKKDNYDYVFAKSVVLYGGKDITNEINVK
ncbi:OmpH family outer membrane protein [bacterium]|nr:OmpH family outer membrane protein [bacterium]